MTIHLPKVNQFGGGNGGGGGSSSFPTIVTDSGSSLPSASGYQEGDTFLNTSDKKIYKAEVNGYIANTNTTITCDIDYSTGIANNIKSDGVARRSGLSDLWGAVGTKQYSIKFKLSSGQTTALVSLYYSGGVQQNSASFVVSGNKIHHIYWSFSYGSYSVGFDNKILDTEIVTDTIYILNITKTGTDCVAQLTLEDGTVVEEKNFTTTNIPYAGNIAYGEAYIENSYVFSSNLSVYLGQSAGELVIPNISTLSWDSGTDITDKTEYADKTNGILYLYQDTELIQIPLIDLSNYKLKATTTTIDTASVTVSEIKANTNYVFSNNAITDITLSGCETSFEETTIEFTTGSTAPTLTDNSGITWVDGSPTFNASKSYLIVIFNKLGFVKEY